MKQADSAEERITLVFRLATARRPEAKEIEVLRRVLNRQLDVYRKDAKAALKLLAVGESPRDERLPVAELAAWNRARGRSVLDQLDDVYRRVGLFVTEQVSLTRPGADGLAQIREAMTRFRGQPPRALAGHAVEAVVDLSRGEGGLPPSDVLVFKLAGGRRVIMRPSGTEPKLKNYYEVRVEVGPGEPIAGARVRGQAELASLRDAHQQLLA